MSRGGMLPHKILKSTLYCFLLFCLLSQSACSNLGIKNACADTYPVSSSGLPEYLDLIWPAPASIQYLRCYEESLGDDYYWYGGVGAEVPVFRVDDPTKYPPDELLPERTELYIDNQLVSRECLEIGSNCLEIIDLNEPGHKTSYGPGAYYLFWLTELGQGKHEAKLVITQNTGGVLEYSWHFYIVSEATIRLVLVGLGLLLAAIVVICFYRHNRRTHLPTALQAQLIIWVIIGLLFESACTMINQSTPLGAATQFPSSTFVDSHTPIKTDGVEPISRDELTVADFYFMEYGMSYDEITKRVGPADEDVASGLYDFVYELKDGSTVHLICSSTMDPFTIYLLSAHFVLPDGTSGYILEPHP